VKKGHTNLHFRKGNQTTNQFTEATLLRAMETAGKQVDDEDLRELMKENGIDDLQREPILLKRF
jgi:DNA topoisomerase-3